MNPEIIESVVTFIRRRDWVSFAELGRFAEGRGLETTGDLAMQACPNGVMWAGMSAEFVELVDALRDDGRVTLDSGHWLAYLADGAALSLPIAKRMPRDAVKGYAKPRWIPTFFRPKQLVSTS